MTQVDEEEEDGVKIGSIPSLKASRPEAGDEHRTPPDPVLDTPDLFCCCLSIHLDLL